MGFVESVLQYTKQSESPRRYYYWAALAAVSAVVKNNVYVNRQGGRLKLYPNIFVLLVGRSGLRKGPPINLVRALVDAVDNTRVITGRTSIQALVTALQTAITKSNGGPPLTDSAALLVSSEFASFIINDPAALTILTDLYDGHYNPEWTNRTKMGGIEALRNVNITMIGASNEVHLKGALPENAIGGGFLARTFVIHATKKDHSDPGIGDQSNHYEEEFGEMVRQLVTISKIKGQMQWEPKAEELYKSWYLQFDEEDHADDLTGTLERFHDHVLKTAMLISLARAPDLQINYEDVQEAIMACKDFVPGAKRVALSHAGMSAGAAGTAAFIKDLLSQPNYQTSRMDTLQRNWRYYDAQELDRIAESQQAAGVIKISAARGKDGKPDINYVMNPKIVEAYERKNS